MGGWIITRGAPRCPSEFAKRQSRTDHRAAPAIQVYLSSPEVPAGARLICQFLAEQRVAASTTRWRPVSVIWFQISSSRFFHQNVRSVVGRGEAGVIGGDEQSRQCGSPDRNLQQALLQTSGRYRPRSYPVAGFGVFHLDERSGLLLSVPKGDRWDVQTFRHGAPSG